jgi:hypothetical protein
MYYFRDICVFHTLSDFSFSIKMIKKGSI